MVVSPSAGRGWISPGYTAIDLVLKRAGLVPGLQRSERVRHADLHQRRKAHVAQHVVQALVAAEHPAQLDGRARAQRHHADVGAEAPASAGREPRVADTEIRYGCRV